MPRPPPQSDVTDFSLVVRVGAKILKLCIGNRLTDGASTWSYGGNNRPTVISVPSTSVIVQAGINALGQRITKTVNGIVTRFVYDEAGRLTNLGMQSRTSSILAIARYEYSPSGDLSAVSDASGSQTLFGYEGHLLVRRTDRNGVRSFFGYDGIGSEAKCLRSWVDGGFRDHELTYTNDGK